MMHDHRYPTFDDRYVTANLNAWFKESGTEIRRAESDLIKVVLPNLFGYHIVQIGTHVSKELIASTRIGHRIVIDRECGENVGVVGHCDALPLLANSIDVLVAPHVLEFARDPHSVLREAERVLIGEGHLILMGFNPWSLCGIWRLLAGWRGRSPWSGHFISLTRIRDWLKLLGFEVEFVKKVSFRPPMRGERLRDRFRFMEQLGSYCWPFFGNVFFVVAKKRVDAVTPLKASWRTRRRLIASGVANPTTRCSENSPDSVSIDE